MSLLKFIVMYVLILKNLFSAMKTKLKACAHLQYAVSHPHFTVSQDSGSPMLSSKTEDGLSCLSFMMVDCDISKCKSKCSVSANDFCPLILIFLHVFQAPVPHPAAPCSSCLTVHCPPTSLIHVDFDELYKYTTFAVSASNKIFFSFLFLKSHKQCINL